MDKASKAIRRSGVKLKSMSSGHGDLQMVISELKDVRQAARLFMTAQNSAAQDMLKWSVNSDNRAMQDIMSQIAELNNLWTEVQKDFAEDLKELKHQFDMMLESEHHVDQARNHFTALDQKEIKIKKELKKASKKCNHEEISNLELKLSQAERVKDLAQLELLDRIRENEAVKMIRLKQGLLRASEAYVELATKCIIIFKSQKEITHELPDVHEKDLHEIKYTGTGTTKLLVNRAKEKVKQHRRQSYHLIPHTAIDDLPPPYSPGSFDMNLSGLSVSSVNSSLMSNPCDQSDNRLSDGQTIQRQRAVPGVNHPEYNPNSEYRLSHPRNFNNTDPSAPIIDVPWDNNYENELSGAMGGAKI